MEEWDALPWWVSQMYWDGLEREFTPPDTAESESEEESSSTDRLEDMGVQVRRKRASVVREAGA